MHCGIHLLVEFDIPQSIRECRSVLCCPSFSFIWLPWVLDVAAESSVAACGLLSNCVALVSERASSVIVENGLSCPVACGLLIPQPGMESPLYWKVAS